MYEYTVVHPVTLNGRVFGVGQKITDANLFGLLELPKYARSVSRHYVTTPPAPQEPVSIGDAEQPRLPAPSSAK